MKETKRIADALKLSVNHLTDCPSLLNICVESFGQVGRIVLLRGIFLQFF